MSSIEPKAPPPAPPMTPHGVSPLEASRWSSRVYSFGGGYCVARRRADGGTDHALSYVGVAPQIHSFITRMAADAHADELNLAATQATNLLHPAGLDLERDRLDMHLTELLQIRETSLQLIKARLADIESRLDLGELSLLPQQQQLRAQVDELVMRQTLLRALLKRLGLLA